MRFHKQNPLLGTMYGDLAEDKSSSVSNSQYKPPTPIHVLPPQKSLPAEKISSSDFQQTFPDLLKHIQSSQDCYFDYAGNILDKVPDAICANAWGYLHAPTPQGYGIPLENHNAILEMVSSHLKFSKSRPSISPRDIDLS